MREQLQTGLDFYYQTNKDNPFHIHRSSNAASQALVHLRNQAFILNKLSLLPNVIRTPLEEEMLQLAAICIEGLSNNPTMPYKNFEAVRDLITHIQLYYQRILLNRSNTEVSIYWPKIRAALMTIQDKIPKTGHQWVREYVMIRRALLEPDKKYFVSQMLAKKIETEQLRTLINSYKQQKQLQDTPPHADIDDNDSNPFSKQYSLINPNNNSLMKTIKNRVRMIALTDEDTDWQYLQQISKNVKLKLLDLTNQQDQQLQEYVKDILDSFLKKRKSTGYNEKKISNSNIIGNNGSGGTKFRSNSLRGRVLIEYLRVLSA